LHVLATTSLLLKFLEEYRNGINIDMNAYLHSAECILKETIAYH